MFKIFKTAVVALGVFVATGAIADGHAGTSWSLDGASSVIGFGSIKKDTVGEAHTITGLSGSVMADGMADIEIDLTTVQTNIDIRNERIGEFVFGGVGTASLKAQIDMDALNGLGIGESTVTEIEGDLVLLGQEIPVYMDVFVMRTAEGQTMVTTNSMLFVSTEEAGIDAGIDKLMELADLPGITRAFPVTFRLMFNADVQKAEAAPAAPATDVVAVAGDAEAGKRVWRSCRSCHAFEAGKNGTGPSLHGVLGATAGQVEGFRYSEEMVASGIVWTPETLTAFITNPREYVPGTKMSFRGEDDPTKLADLIAYIAQEAAAE